MKKQDNSKQRKPDPVRIQILRLLPLHIKETLTKEEVNAFIYNDVCPDSLEEKLKDYLIDD